MGQLQEIEDELKELGYQIIAASPDEPKKLRETADKNQLTYRLVFDSGLRAAEAFGLVFRPEQAALEKYRELGVEVKDAKLPVPAVFVISRDGKIAFAYSNPDYRVRIDPNVLLAAARSAFNH